MIFRFAIALCIFLSASSHGGVLARFKMNNDLGTIDVELFEQDKSVTVSNFVAYVKAGAWHDNMIHRWLPGFVLQGGSFKVPHTNTLMTPWTVDPTQGPQFPPIPFERDHGTFYPNLFGTLTMARVGSDTNSASHDWFFNLADNTNLNTQDGGYTVFGRTLRGTNTLARFNKPAGSTNIYQYSLQSPEVPVYSVDRSNVFWVNVDITLLTAEIARVRGAIEISWNSVEGKQNIVEFTTVIPAAWQTLQSVAGTGDRMTVVDPAANDTMRQYRVRIDYSN